MNGAMSHTLGWKSFLGKQTETYQAHSHVTKKMKCCEYDSYDCIHNISFPFVTKECDK